MSTLLSSNTRLGSIIVISNVGRSQLKFFRPKGHIEDPLQINDTSYYTFFRKNAPYTVGQQARSRQRKGRTILAKASIAPVVATRTH